MRREVIAPGEYYHIYNRGVGKSTIFHNRQDFLRFVFLIFYFQAPLSFNPLGRYVKKFVEHPEFNIEKLMKKRYVELVSFCVLPNHFHLIVKELDDSGISRYMQKALNSYTKYHNTKYGTSGHIFQGPYQTVHIEDDRQLLYLSAYVHKNPTNWKNYNWSSYRDFIGKNRWGKLLRNGIIVDQFDEGAYEQFVNTSVAKEPKEEYGVEC